MSSETWERVKRIFDEVCKRPAGEREAYLRNECAGDDRLRTEVETLLRAHSDAGSFLGDRNAMAGEKLDTSGVTFPGRPLSEGPGTVIGRYKLLQLIGEGGFGSVYMAEQQEPVRRKVALKIIKLGMDTKQVIARFEAERQALALMDHPNIARVLDAGATDTGRPYFVMELVKGVPITEYCNQSNMSMPDRLRLFQAVCGAVQHAHQKGIIHRDIKPSNVMVTLHDGTPVPKVIDFGIAKATNQRLTEKTLFTEYHQFIGTPEYMSPEQAEMSGLDIDTRSDIYSLGVLLYELITGTTPFDSKRLRGMAYSEIHRVIRDEEPQKPSTRVSSLGDSVTDTAKHMSTDARALKRSLSGDLDWIVMKALEKDRTRRYETANSLMLDVGRHLEKEPVLAGAPSMTYRARKFVQRNRTVVAVAGVVGLALVTGLAVATYGFVQASRERTIARQEAGRVKAINDFYTEMLAMANPQQLHRHSTFQSSDMYPENMAQFEHSSSVAEMLENATKRIETRFADAPLLGAHVRETIGATLTGLESREAALEQFQIALDIRKSHLPPDDVEVLRSRLMVATSIGFLNRMNEAEALARDVFEDLEARVGPDDPLTLFAASLCAAAATEQGRMSEADSLYEVTLERQRAVLGSDHRDTILTMLGWAGAYCWRGRGLAAGRLAGEACDRARNTYSDDDAIVIAAENTYALALAFQGSSQAEPIARKAMEKSRRIFGENHESTLNIAFSLARSLDVCAEKESLYTRRYAARGPMGWVVARDLGQIRMVLGDVDGSLDVLREQHDFWNSERDEIRAHVGPERLKTIREQATRHYRGALAFLERWNSVKSLTRIHLEQLRERAEAPDATPIDKNEYAYELLVCELPELRNDGRAMALATAAVNETEPSDSVSLANVLDTRAKAFEKLGDVEAALKTETRAAELVRGSFNRHLLQFTTAQVVRYALELDQLDTARDQVRRTVEAIDRRFGAGTEAAVNHIRWLGIELEGRGYHDLAEMPLEYSVDAARNLQNQEWLLRGLVAFGRSRARAGDLSRSDALLLEAAELYGNVFGGEPIEWRKGIGFADEGERSGPGVRVKRNLASAFVEAGHVERGRELLDQVLCSSMHRNLTAQVLRAEGSAEGALPYFRRMHFSDRFAARELSEETSFARREAAYGDCLARAGRFEEAERYLLRAHARALEWAGERSELTGTIAEDIGELYQRWGKGPAAAEWTRRGGGG